MARDRDTYINTRHGVSPETTSVISSKNKIYAISADRDTAEQIGVIATFNPTESRSVEPVRGIGYGDHVAELVPGYTDHMTISVDRTAQYLSNLYQVFGYKGGVDGIVRSLRHHKWPFDITQELVISRLVSEDYKDSLTDAGGKAVSIGNESLSAIMTYYQGCWLSDFNTSYTSDTALVQESVTVNVTDIVSSSSGAGYDDELETDDQFFNKAARTALISTK